MPALKGQPGPKPLTIEDMQALAKRHRGVCLSAQYMGINTKLRWQCDRGHTWDFTPGNVKAGS